MCFPNKKPTYQIACAYYVTVSKLTFTNTNATKELL